MAKIIGNTTTTPINPDLFGGGDGDESKIHIGTEPPTNENAEVWINPEGTLSGLPSTGGGDVDLSGYATKDELNAKADASSIPTKVSQLTNDSGYLTTAPVTKVNNKTGEVTLSATDVGARPNTWTPNYTDVGADKSGTADTKVSTHNTNETAHNDIRLLIEGLTTRLNTLANSTDEDLDQMAELVAYIKANKQLIDGITTSKVSVADIIDNLTTSVSNKPLSAKQGVALKSLIDGLSTTKLDTSALTSAINTALAQAKSSGEFDGADGTNGKDGTSVTVKSVSESSADGGNNVITFSDGKTVTIKNGSKGSKGDNAMVDSTYNPESENAQSGKAVAEAINTLDNVLRDILTAIQSGSSATETIDAIEQTIVSYLENKTIAEVEE